MVVARCLEIGPKDLTLLSLPGLDVAASVDARRALAELALNGEGPLQVIRRRGGDCVILPSGSMPEALRKSTAVGSEVRMAALSLPPPPACAGASEAPALALAQLSAALADAGLEGLISAGPLMPRSSILVRSSDLPKAARALAQAGFLEGPEGQEDQDSAHAPSPVLGGSWGGLGVAFGRSAVAKGASPGVWRRSTGSGDQPLTVLFDSGCGPYVSVSVPSSGGPETLHALGAALQNGHGPGQDVGGWSRLDQDASALTVLELLAVKTKGEVVGASKHRGVWIFAGKLFVRAVGLVLRRWEAGTTTASASKAASASEGGNHPGDVVMGIMEGPGKLRTLRRSWVADAEGKLYLDAAGEVGGSVEVHRASGVVVHRLADGSEQHWKVTTQRGEDPFGAAAAARGAAAAAAAQAAAKAAAASAAADAAVAAESRAIRGGFLLPLPKPAAEPRSPERRTTEADDKAFASLIKKAKEESSNSSSSSDESSSSRKKKAKKASRSRSKRSSRSRSKKKSRSRDKEKKDKEKGKDKDRAKEKEKDRGKSRDRDRDRDKDRKGDKKRDDDSDRDRDRDRRDKDKEREKEKDRSHDRAKDRDREKEKEKDRRRSRSKEKEKARASPVRRSRSPPRKRERRGFDQREPAGVGFGGSQALALVQMQAAQMFPGQVSGLPGGPSAVPTVQDPEVEAFLAMNPVDSGTASRFRALPLNLQRMVLVRGSLVGTRDPSAVLMSRVRDAIQNGGGASAMAGMALPGAPPIGSTPEVEAFLASNPVDFQAASRLRALPPHLQRLVLIRGSLSGVRDASSVLMSRVRDAMGGGGAAAMQVAQMQPGQQVQNFRAGDWMCPKCNFHNYSSKLSCTQCGTHQAMGVPLGPSGSGLGGFTV